MFDLTITNFKTLETKKVMTYDFMDIENIIKDTLECDEIVFREGKYFIKKENEIIGGCVIKQLKKPKIEILNGDIFYADLGDHSGTSIQSGTRPVLVVSNNACNKFSDVITIVPLTSQNKNPLPTHLKINEEQHTGLDEPSTIICEQILSINKTQLRQRIGYLKTEQMDMIGERLKTQLNLK